MKRTAEPCRRIPGDDAGHHDAEGDRGLAIAAVPELSSRPADGRAEAQIAEPTFCMRQLLEGPSAEFQPQGREWGQNVRTRGTCSRLRQARPKRLRRRWQPGNERLRAPREYRITLTSQTSLRSE